MKTQDVACAHCPWRRSNQGKPHPDGWYTKKNLRRLWAGLRSGEAPGMTCHPTDPNNPVPEGTKPVPADVETRECYGALLLVARELRVVDQLEKAGVGRGLYAAYHQMRPRGFTKRGAFSWACRAVAPALAEMPPMPTTFVEDEDIQHPDFEAPK